MFVLRVERSVIGIGLLQDFGDADDAGGLDAAVIEEDLVADLHLPHKISRLVVAHAVPAGGLLRRLRQVVNRESLRLRFHQPVFHLLYSILLREINHESVPRAVASGLLLRRPLATARGTDSWLILLFPPRREQHLENITPRIASSDGCNANSPSASIRP